MSRCHDSAHMTGMEDVTCLPTALRAAIDAPERKELSAAWVAGAEINADMFGDVDSSDCPYDDPELAAAWRDGTETLRDWDGRADLTANPYSD